MMDVEKNPVEDQILPINSETNQNLTSGGNLRIQFTPTVKPDRTRHIRDDEFPRTLPTSSIRQPSIPRVVSEKERIQHKHEKEEINIDEHLMNHDDVAERYKTRINMKKPGESIGLTCQEVENLLHEHGPNVLTPPKKRHPFLKYLDCLRSLFNLLLILAGILEYILLGIDYKDNFQNVS